MKRWLLFKHETNGEYFVMPEGMSPSQHYLVKPFLIPAPYFLCACAYKLIYAALEQLGYEDPDFLVERVAEDRYKVTLGESYFGVYDTRRKTFID